MPYSLASDIERHSGFVAPPSPKRTSFKRGKKFVCAGQDGDEIVNFLAILPIFQKIRVRVNHCHDNYKLLISACE